MQNGIPLTKNEILKHAMIAAGLFKDSTIVVDLLPAVKNAPDYEYKPDLECANK